jgi:hypothetical protein
MRGVSEPGERAMNREALVTKAKGRRSAGRAAKVSVLTWGDLVLCPKGQHGA